MRVFRVILPVEDIEEATRFYGTLLAADGERVTIGRHYFDCDGVLLACWDLHADGDATFPGPNSGHVYLTTNEPLDAVRQRAIDAGAVPDSERRSITRQPWGEHSFYARDPWGNPFCIVESGTEYRGGSFKPITSGTEERADRGGARGSMGDAILARSARPPHLCLIAASTLKSPTTLSVQRRLSWPNSEPQGSGGCT